MKNILIIGMLVCSLFAQARSVTEMFMAMPDSVLPYMTQEVRKQLIDLKAIQPDSVTTLSTAMGNVSLTSLSDSTMHLKLSDAVSFEIGRLDDNHFVVINTYGAPEKESTCFVCDSIWQNIVPQGFSEMNFFTDSATVEQHKMVEFPLVEVHLSESPKTLRLQLNAPLLTKEDKKELMKYTMQRIAKWNGTTFK